MNQLITVVILAILIQLDVLFTGILWMICVCSELKMSTRQLHLQSGSWTDTFPETQVTQLQSTVFMKKLLAVAISNIAYMRVILPEEAFSDRNLEGLNLKLLRDDKTCPFASQMIDWLKGVFDAIDKAYLRMVVLGIYRGCSDPHTLMEMYTFRFSYKDATEMEIYSNDLKISSASTASETKKATISLLRSLSVLIQTLRPLPDDVRVAIKLYYYDDVTPEDYEPPGFKPAETDAICMEGNPTKFHFPSVSTSFHTLRLRAIVDDATADDDEVASVPGHQQMTEAVVTGMDVDVGDTQSMQEAFADSTTLETRSIAEHFSKSSAAADDRDSAAHDVEPLGVRCPCLANEDDGLMVLCSGCHYWQHAVCFKILDASTAPERHICNLCCHSSRPTDQELAGIHESEAQMICLWRRSLATCLELDHINPAQLASCLGVTKSVAGRLIDRLVCEGYASSKGKHSTATKFVQKRKIKREALPKYLTRNNESVMDIEP